jgi:hypothetical protein
MKTVAFLAVVGSGICCASVRRSREAATAGSQGAQAPGKGSKTCFQPQRSGSDRKKIFCGTSYRAACATHFVALHIRARGTGVAEGIGLQAITLRAEQLV